MIGEITVITTFSSGEDENRKVMIMKSIVVIREHIFMMKFTITSVRLKMSKLQHSSISNCDIAI